MVNTQMKSETRPKNWYTIKVQNNHEKKVCERIKSDMAREYNEEIKAVVPIQNVILIKDGKRVQKEQILYPGYIFVETSSIGSLDILVKGTNGATNILKDKSKTPIILRNSEVERMFGEKDSDELVLKNMFYTGEKVMIIDGPFQNFKGIVESIDISKDRVKVEVLIFGRKTMVDLTLADITKSDE